MDELNQAQIEELLTKVACCLPEDVTDEERAKAAETVREMLSATPAKGGNRVAVMRDLGWNHGVCYKRETQLLIAAMCAIGRGEEQWDKMPRRGRPKKETQASRPTDSEAVAS